MKGQSLISSKNKKNIISLSSAKFAQRWVMVNVLFYYKKSVARHKNKFFSHLRQPQEFTEKSQGNSARSIESRFLVQVDVYYEIMALQCQD